MPRTKSNHAHEVKPTGGELPITNTDTEVSVKGGRQTSKQTKKLLELARSGHSVPDIAASTGIPKPRLYKLLSYHGVKANKVKNAKPLLTSVDILKLVKHGMKAPEIAKEYGIKAQRVYNVISYYKEKSSPGRPKLPSGLTKADVEQEKLQRIKKERIERMDGIAFEKPAIIQINLTAADIEAIAKKAVSLIPMEEIVHQAVSEFARRASRS